MNQVQMYSLVASIYTKIEKASSLDELDKYLFKFVIAQICEKKTVNREDIIQIIEFSPTVSRVICELTGKHAMQIINERMISLFEMLFFIDSDGSII